MTLNLLYVILHTGQKEFVLKDEKPVNKGGIRGTKAKLHTVKGTPIGVYISDPRHPERAELKTLSVSDNFSVFILGSM